MKRNAIEKHLLLDDEPIEREDMDEFEHSIFVDVLLDLIRDTDGPCNIGLFGKWGVGKTSIVQMLFNKVRNDSALSENIKCLYFDVWKYSDESLRSQFLVELNEKLGKPVDREDIIDAFFNITEEEIKYKFKNKRERVIKFFSNLKVFFISLFLITFFDITIYIFFPVAEIAYLITVSLIFPLAAELISKMHLATVSANKRRVLPRKEWSGEFETVFKSIISHVQEVKIVTVIDNLDRCQSKTVVKILALLKTFMDTPRCIYIVPCDDEAILCHFRALDKEKYFARNGQEFLRKIFQVMIRIPPFLEESLEEYAQKLRSRMKTEFDNNVQDVIISAHIKNPRRVIHAFNRLTVLYLLAKKKEENGIIRKGLITNRLPFLAKISVIEDEWIDFYKELFHNVFLLDEVENIFKHIVSNEKIQGKIMKYFGENPELEDFLNATRAIRVDDIAPFLLLSQETYESSIPELERLRLHLYENNVDQILNIIKKAPDTGKSYYLKEILRICKQAVMGERYNLGFNCLNILSHVYKILPDGLLSEFTREFGNYLDRPGLVEFSSSFDMEKLFEILPHIPRTNRDSILNNLVSSIFSGEYVDNVLLSKLTENSELVGTDPKKRLNDIIIEKLNTEKPEIAGSVITFISQNEIAKKNLFEQRLLHKVIETITRDENGHQEGADLYLKVKDIADQKTKERFISKELDFLIVPIGDRTANVDCVLSVFWQLDTDDIPQSQVNRLYIQIIDKFDQIPIDKKMECLKFIMKIFTVLSDSDKNDFITVQLKEIVARGDLERIVFIFNSALEFDIDAFCHEEILDSLLQSIPDKICHEDVLTYVVRYVPSNKQENVKKKLMDILQDGGPREALSFLRAIDGQLACFERTHSDEIAGACIRKALEWDDPSLKDAALMPLSKQFSVLSQDKKESHIDCIINLLENDNLRIIGKKHYDLVNELLEEQQKRRILFELLLKLTRMPAEELNEEIRPLMEVLLDLQHVMKKSDTENFLRNILRMLKRSDNAKQRRSGLEYLGQIEKLYGLKDLVLEQAERATRADDKQITYFGKKILNSLKKRRDSRKTKS